MNPLRQLYVEWTNLPAVKFVIVTTLLSIVFTIPVMMLLKAAGVESESMNIPDIRGMGIIWAIIYGVIIAPFVETIIGQTLPIFLVQRFVRWHPNVFAIILSTVVFAAAHLTHSIFYPLIILPTALFLALTYIIFQQRKESSILMTFAVHATKNLLAVLAVFGTFEKG